HAQLGLVAIASCDDYLHDHVRKHESTRPDKEDDRVRHIESLQAQTGPAFLVYPPQPQLTECFSHWSKTAWDIDFVAGDGVRHTSWTIGDPSVVEWIEQQFVTIPSLYIADGHHRTAAAARLHRQHLDSRSAGYFLSVLFPADQVQI